MSFYRMSIRTKKWTLRTIMHFVDVALVNAWLQYKSDEQYKGARRKDVMQFLDFRLKIAQTYIATEDRADTDDDSSDDDAAAPKRRRFTPVPGKVSRTAGAKHLPEIGTVKNSMRCRNTTC